MMLKYFCGGTIATLTSIGHKVGVIDLTQGELSSQGNLETRNAETIKSNPSPKSFFQK